jgi:6-phosphogluconate dehydrogenase
MDTRIKKIIKFIKVEFLEPGDIIIDGGNSEYKDTQRRCKELKTVPNGPILFVGSGVSGGEEGARYGPSIMPGGDLEAWPHVKAIFQGIAAKVDGEPCCDWVGDDGAGHFVKMVHNGIEYGDMQLICEAYDILKSTLGMQQDEIAKVRRLYFMKFKVKFCLGVIIQRFSNSSFKVCYLKR